MADRLAERPVDLMADAPEVLVDEQWRLDAARGRLQTRLIEAAGKGDEEGEKQARWELTQLQTQQEALEVRIRKEAPAYAALQYPEPLDVEGMQAALDPGTLLLAYGVDEKATFLFTLTRGEAPEVTRIEVAEEDLRDQIGRLRVLIGNRRNPTEPLAGMGRLLLGPAREQIAAAERVLVLPDGPLHYVPFHALPYHHGNARQGTGAPTRGENALPYRHGNARQGTGAPTRGEHALPLGLEKPVHNLPVDHCV